MENAAGKGPFWDYRVGVIPKARVSQARREISREFRSREIPLSA
jgi:hypothetical protein